MYTEKRTADSPVALDYYNMRGEEQRPAKENEWAQTVQEEKSQTNKVCNRKV